MKITPIKPTDISPNMDIIIPDFVIEAVNEILKEKYRSGTNTVRIEQSELIKRVTKINPKIKPKEIFDNHMFDFEKLYEKYGWKVKYRSPDRDESFDEFFIFKPKK